MDDDRDCEDVDHREAERRAAMDLAERQAMSGCPIAGSLFGFLHSIRHDPLAAFEDDFWFWSDDDSDEVRPY